MNPRQTSRKAEALEVADELLADIELRRLSGPAIAFKASRLARLVDDDAAFNWLGFEHGGFGVSLSAEAEEAARRSGRIAAPDEDGSPRYWTTTLGEIEAGVQSQRSELVTLGGDVAGDWAYRVEIDRSNRRDSLTRSINHQERLREAVLASIYRWVASTYHVLRFGGAAESAFDVLRAEVDQHLVHLIPDALPKLSAAFANLESDNPEHWAHAASTCRRALKAAADALRPPGEKVNGRRMDDAAYVNRLMDWIQNRSESGTSGELSAADLEDLGRRLDAINDAGNKGAHAEVSRLDAARFLVGTYLLLADVARLSPEPNGMA